MNLRAPTPVSIPRHAGYFLVGLAIGVAIAVVTFLALGGLFGGTAPSTTTPHSAVSCPSSVEASIGTASSSGPPVEVASVSVHSHAWAAGATRVVVTQPIPVAAGSTLLVFVGFVGPSVGGPLNATVCDSTGDAFFQQTSTSEYSSNHTELLFLAFDAVGGSSVSFAANFSDTSAAAGGTMGVVDLSSASSLRLAYLTVGTQVGDSGLANVPMLASNPSLVLFGVSGQGNDGPFAAVGTETLLDTHGYYDAGPWTDGESIGTFVLGTSGGAVDPSGSLAVPGVWAAIAVIVT